MIQGIKSHRKFFMNLTLEQLAEINFFVEDFSCGPRGFLLFLSSWHLYFVMYYQSVESEVSFFL